MSRLLIAAAVAATSLALCGVAAAQSNAAATPARPAAKPATPAAKPAPAARQAAAPAQPEPVIEPASGEQMLAVELAHFGEYQCEFDKKLVAERSARHPGYVDVRFAGATYTMKPVLSHTGALRLEDVRGQMLVVQIATKSMMMDTRAGRRVIDGCTSDKQREFAATFKGESIGINAPAAGPTSTTTTLR